MAPYSSCGFSTSGDGASAHPPARLPTASPLLAAVMAVAVAVGGAAHAQQNGEESQDDRGTTVLERTAALYGQHGTRLGSFLLLPRVAAAIGNDTNIYLLDKDPVEDVVAAVAPAIALNSDWSTHELNLVADAQVGRNAATSSEDYEDFHGGVNGRLDVSRISHFYAAYDSWRLHEGRGSQNDVRGEVPTEYDFNQLVLRYFQRLNRLSFTLDGSLGAFDFDDVPAAGRIINNDDRDRDELDLSLRTAWAFVPQVEGFVRLAVNERTYVDAVDDNGFARDSEGSTAVVGTTLDLGGVTYGDIYAGYHSQDYSDANLVRLSETILGAELVWNPDAATTVTGTVRQSVEETIAERASGFLATVASVTLDHAFRRDLIASASIGRTRFDYKGIERNDDLDRVSFGLRHWISRGFVVSANYGFARRVSDVAGGFADFERHRLDLRVEARF